MAWVSVNGRKFDFPDRLAAAAIGTGNERVKELVTICAAIHDEAMLLDGEVRSLRDDNRRLVAELNFMIHNWNAEMNRVLQLPEPGDVVEHQ